MAMVARALADQDRFGFLAMWPGPQDSGDAEIRAMLTNPDQYFARFVLSEDARLQHEPREEPEEEPSPAHDPEPEAEPEPPRSSTSRKRKHEETR